MIKKLTLGLLTAAALTGLAAAADIVPPAVEHETGAAACPAGHRHEAETAESEAGPAGFTGHLYRMGRGVANVGTCFLEIPRCMLYDNSEVPLWGLVYGVFEGAGCTVMRAFCGVVDIISLGFDSGRAYEGNFREFVWQSDWLSPTAKKRNGGK